MPQPTSPTLACPSTDTSKKRKNSELKATVKPQGVPPTGPSYQQSDCASLCSAKIPLSVEETDTLLTSRTTNAGYTGTLSPVTKSIVTAEADDDTLMPRSKAALGNSVVVVPATPQTVSSSHEPSVPTSNDVFSLPSSSGSRSTPSAHRSDILKSTPAAARPPLTSSVNLPSGIDCCPIPRWNWVQSESTKRKDSQASSSRSQRTSTGDKIDSSIFGVTEANRESMENLSPFKQWEFTRFLATPADASTTSSQPFHSIKPTIVLDLDETLVHTSTELMGDADTVVTVHVPAKQSPGGRSSSYMMYIKYRHSLRKFLHYCLAHFDVIVFTASRNYYAAAIVEQLEKDMPELRFVGPDQHSVGAKNNNTITLLSRDHCTPTNAGYVKDLFLLGCDLRRTVLIDNNIVCGAFQPYNFIHIRDFARRPQADGAKSVESAKHDAEKGMVLSGSSSPASPLSALTRSSGSSDSSALIWVDPNDTVLEDLIAPNGLLEFLTKCDDIPSGLRHVLAESIMKQHQAEKQNKSTS